MISKNQMKILFIALALFFTGLQSLSAYQQNNYYRYQQPPYYATNSMLEDAFSMMYINAGMTPCSQILQNNEEDFMASMGVIFSIIDSANLKNFSKENIIKGINASYQYCRQNPDALFATALVKTSGINFGTASAHGKRWYKADSGINAKNKADLVNQEDSNYYNQQSNGNNQNFNYNTHNQSASDTKDKVRIIN